MLKKKIKYTNAFGEEKTKVAYFQLSQSELIELKFKHESIIDGFDTEDNSSGNIKRGLMFIKDLIYSAYFETDEDGDYINKSREVKERFLNSFAGVALVDSLLADPKESEEFILAITPKSNSEELKAAMTNGLIQ